MGFSRKEEMENCMALEMRRRLRDQEGLPRDGALLAVESRGEQEAEKAETREQLRKLDEWGRMF